MNRLVAVGLSLVAGAAYAGCGDVLALRVDEAMSFSDTQAEFHGAYAWEASPDGWQTHPLGGSDRGYLQLTCGSQEANCKTELRRFVALAGTGKVLQFLTTGLQKGVRPGFLSAEGQPLASQTPPWPEVVDSAKNRAVQDALAAMPAKTDSTKRGCSSAGDLGTTALALGLLLRFWRRRSVS